MLFLFSFFLLYFDQNHSIIMKNLLDIKNWKRFEHWLKNTIKEGVKDALQSIIISNENTELPFYNIEQTAQLLGVCKNTMYTLNQENRITYHKAGKNCFYFMEDIINYVKQEKVSANFEIKNNVEQLKIGKTK